MDKSIETFEFSSCYDTLCLTDDVQIFEDGMIIIEAELSETIELFTSIADLEALVQRAKKWKEGRLAYARNSSNNP